jgi:cytidyltransferase-like protein
MIAFFPGKFHPPHIGHLQTIMNVAEQYTHVIVGVTGDIPDHPLVTAKDIAICFKRILGCYKHISVQLINGVLCEKKTLDDLPKFDILLSGNERVLHWAESMGIKHQFVERSFGFDCSGTNIRKQLRNEKHFTHS